MFEILEGGTQPKIKTVYSSSADLYAREDVIIQAGETKIIPLGVKIDLSQIKEIVEAQFEQESIFDEDGTDCIKQGVFANFMMKHFFELKLRSSLAKKLIIPNGVGEIDIDYPEEIGLMVHFPVSLEAVELLSQLNALKMIGHNDGNSPEQIEKAGKIFAEASPHKDKIVYKIKAGERVAQIKLMEHKNFMMPFSYRSDEKRTSGFGSTGKKN